MILLNLPSGSNSKLAENFILLAIKFTIGWPRGYLRSLLCLKFKDENFSDKIVQIEIPCMGLQRPALANVWKQKSKQIPVFKSHSSLL